MLRAPESHTVDPDFDDVTVADLVNGNDTLATYIKTQPQRQDEGSNDWIQRILTGCP